MDVGIALKPISGVVASGHAAPAPAGADRAAPTDLPQAKAIAPATHAGEIRNDERRTDLLRAGRTGQETRREVVIDPQVREVLYRVIDVRSRQVLHQVPDEALLRIRAYARALAARERANEAAETVDVAT